VGNLESVLVIGGINADIKGYPKDSLLTRDSNPGYINISPGGVGRNIAENIAKMGAETYLAGFVGKDVFGGFVIEKTAGAGVNVSLVQEKDRSTGIYLSVAEKSNEMFVAVSDMELTDKIDYSYIDYIFNYAMHINNIIVDTNIDYRVIKYILSKSNAMNKKVFIAGVSKKKNKNLLKIKNDFIDLFVCNMGEMNYIMDNKKIYNIIDNAERINSFLENNFTNVGEILVTASEKGVIRFSDGKYEIFETNVTEDIVDSNGAGDSFFSAYVYSKINNFDLGKSILFSQKIASETLKIKETVLSSEKICEIIDNIK